MLFLPSNLDSTRFYQKLLKWPSVESTPIEVPGTETAKRRGSVRISRKNRNGDLRPSRYQMNEFSDTNEQAFLDACVAIGVEPNSMIKAHKERYLVSEFLKDPVPWLETELLYYSYTTREEAQEVANGIDRMISAPDSVHRVFVGA
jgi:hypothetical protein